MKTFFALLTLGFLASGCDTTSTVDFNKERLIPKTGSEGTAVNGLAWTHGGVARGVTSGGSIVSFSMGEAPDQIQEVTTPGGYKVQLNLQGQLVY